MLESRFAILEERIMAPLRITHQIDQSQPLLVVATGEHEVAVGAFVDSPWDDVCPSAQPADVLSFVRQKGQTQHRRDAFLLGDVDRLSGSGFEAMPKSAHGPDRGMHSGLQLRLMAVEL